MTQEEIIRMAREAGSLPEYCIVLPKDLERFFNLAFAAGAAHEREACAKVCDTMATPETSRDAQHDFHWAAGCCAEAIRARGEK